MIHQLEIEACSVPLSIPSALSKRRVKLSSLRPGDCVQAIIGKKPHYILINSAKLRRAVLRSGFTGNEVIWTYTTFKEFNRYLGQGKPRLWLRYLPRFIAKKFCPYSQP